MSLHEGPIRHDFGLGNETSDIGHSEEDPKVSASQSGTSELSSFEVENLANL